MVGYCWGLGVMSLYSQAWVKLWKTLNGSLKSVGFVWQWGVTTGAFCGLWINRKHDLGKLLWPWYAGCIVLWKLVKESSGTLLIMWRNEGLNSRAPMEERRRDRGKRLHAMLYAWILGEWELWGIRNEILEHFPLFLLLSDFSSIWYLFFYCQGEYFSILACARKDVVASSWHDPSGPHGLVFIPLCDPLTSSVAAPNNLLLTNRIWQNWWDVTSEVRLQKHIGFCLALTGLL